MGNDGVSDGEGTRRTAGEPLCPTGRSTISRAQVRRRAPTSLARQQVFDDELRLLKDNFRREERTLKAVREIARLDAERCLGGDLSTFGEEDAALLNLPAFILHKPAKDSIRLPPMTDEFLSEIEAFVKRLQIYVRTLPAVTSKPAASVESSPIPDTPDNIVHVEDLDTAGASLPAFSEVENGCPQEEVAIEASPENTVGALEPGANVVSGAKPAVWTQQSRAEAAKWLAELDEFASIPRGFPFGRMDVLNHFKQTPLKNAEPHLPKTETAVASTIKFDTFGSSSIEENERLNDQPGDLFGEDALEGLELSDFRRRTLDLVDARKWRGGKAPFVWPYEAHWSLRILKDQFTPDGTLAIAVSDDGAVLLCSLDYFRVEKAYYGRRVIAVRPVTRPKAPCNVSTIAQLSKTSGQLSVVFDGSSAIHRLAGLWLLHKRAKAAGVQGKLVLRKYDAEFEYASIIQGFGLSIDLTSIIDVSDGDHVYFVDHLLDDIGRDQLVSLATWITDSTDKEYLNELRHCLAEETQLSLSECAEAHGALRLDLSGVSDRLVERLTRWLIDYRDLEAIRWDVSRDQRACRLTTPQAA